MVSNTEYVVSYLFNWNESIFSIFKLWDMGYSAIAWFFFLMCIKGLKIFILTLLHANHLWQKKDFYSSLVLVLEDLVGLCRTNQLQLLWHQLLGHRLTLLWCRIVCPGNEQRTFLSFVIFETVPSTAFLTLVDYESYSLSSKGFLPSVVDIMVIWIKFTHSRPF